MDGYSGNFSWCPERGSRSQYWRGMRRFSRKFGEHTGKAVHKRKKRPGTPRYGDAPGRLAGWGRNQPLLSDLTFGSDCMRPRYHEAMPKMPPTASVRSAEMVTGILPNSGSNHIDAT